MRYSSGDAAYDTFFDTLFRAQLKMGTVPQEEEDLRKQLALSVGSTEDKIDPGSLAQAVNKHTDRMAKAGIGVSLTLTGIESSDAVPSAKLETSGVPADEKDKKIITAIDVAAQGEAKLIGDMRQIRIATARLSEDAAALEPGVDATFRKGGPAKRAEVSKNLKDAQALIPLMVRRTDEIEMMAKQTLHQLAQVANTKDKVTPPSPTDTPKIVLEEDPEKPPPRKPHPRAAAPAGAAPPRPAPKPAAPPPPPPPPPPSQGDDFQP